MISRARDKRQFRATVVLSIIVMALLTLLFAATDASAQGAPDLIVLTPDSVSGEFVATVNSAVNDSRVARVCIFRIDSNSPDPLAEVACVDAGLGSAPTPEQAAPSGEGMVYSIPFSTALVAGQDQLFTARNIADIGGGQEISSLNATNSALIPSAVGPPMFIIRAVPAS